MKKINLNLKIGGSPSWGLESENIQQVSVPSLGRVSPDFAWINIMWGEQGKGQKIAHDKFKKVTSERDWAAESIDWKNYKLKVGGYLLRILSNTSDTLTLSSGSLIPLAEGTEYNFKISLFTKAYFFDTQLKKVSDKPLEDWVDEDTEATWSFLTFDEIKTRLRLFKPGSMYRMRLYATDFTRRSAEPSPWRYIHLKVPSSDISILTPKTGDFAIEKFEGGIIVKRTFSDTRWNKIKNIFKGMEIAFCDDGSTRKDTITSTPSFSKTATKTTVVPLTDVSEIKIPTETERKVRILVRFIAFDGSSTSEKEIDEDNNIVSPRSPSLPLGHKPNRLDFDYIDDGTDYKRIPASSKTNYDDVVTEVQESRAGETSLSKKINKFDNVVSRVDKVIDSEGRITIQAAAQAQTAANLISNTIITDDNTYETSGEVDGWEQMGQKVRRNKPSFLNNLRLLAHLRTSDNKKTVKFRVNVSYGATILRLDPPLSTDSDDPAQSCLSGELGIASLAGSPIEVWFEGSGSTIEPRTATFAKTIVDYIQVDLSNF